MKQATPTLCMLVFGLSGVELSCADATSDGATLATPTAGMAATPPESGGAGGVTPSSNGAGAATDEGGNPDVQGPLQMGDDPRGGTGGVEPRTLGTPNGVARNPIVSHIFTADPSAKVFDGRVYVYASHDPDDQTGYDMKDYHVFSSNDLVNWQDHGVALDAANVTWTDTLYAPDCAYGAATGKYYLYFPNAGSGIGVAVSDSPAGPFVDALGRPLIDGNVPGVADVDWLFDPMAFVDDDGQAYLYFGGGPSGTGDNARVIRLNPDMVSLKDAAATTIPAPDFFEASFMHERDGKYYFSYSTSSTNHAATIDYMMSDNPMTGFQYVGTLLPNPADNDNNNNHSSVVEYAGSWYIFYHNRVLAHRDGFSGFQRSITVDHLTFEADGKMTQVPAQKGPVAQLQSVDAFSRMEAEAMADQRGVEIEFATDGASTVGVDVTDLQDQDWIGYSQVDFGAGASAIHARVASDAPAGAAIEVYQDGCGVFTDEPGTLIGACAVPNSGGPQSWVDVECPVTASSGVHDLCLRFVGSGGPQLLNLDYFHFE
jgi:arabinoxylan arabinofuranohydrolase